jgi:hypothetical protein
VSLPRKLAPAIASLALAASSAPASIPDPGRLSSDVVPTFESLHLALDPAQMANYDFLASHLPPSSVPGLPWQANGCSIERVAKARAFFSKPPHDVVGTDKEMEKVEAAIRDCASLQQREGAAVARYLARQGAELK